MENALLTGIGKRLRKGRREKGLTQKEAAEILEISANFYGEVERGNRRLSLEKIKLADEKMRLNPNYLLLGKDECLECPLSRLNRLPEQKRKYFVRMMDILLDLLE